MEPTGFERHSPRSFSSRCCLLPPRSFLVHRREGGITATQPSGVASSGCHLDKDEYTDDKNVSQKRAYATPARGEALHSHWMQYL